MIWILGVLCALALVALFFPFVFWIDFGADFNGTRARVSLYKKVLYTFKKNFRKEKSTSSEEGEPEKPSEESSEKRENSGDDAGNDASAELPKDQPAVQEEADKESAESAVEASAEAPSTPLEKEEAPKQTEEKPEGPTEETAAEKTATEEEAKESATDEALPHEAITEEEKNETESDEADSKEKRSLSDKEFWTLLLTPEFDSRAWWSVRHLTSAFLKLFRVRFVNCFVEGFRMEYHHMGYAAALNGFLKSYPYIGDWDFRMDWTRDHDPRIEGHVRISVNLCRLLGLSIATLFYGGIVAWSFWRRRTHILKTGELPELGFIRSKIVKMMMEDN